MPFAWNQVGNAFNSPGSGGGLGDYKNRLIAAAIGLLQGDDWKEQVGGGLGGFLQGDKLDKDNRTEIDRKRVLDEAMASPELGIPGSLRGVLSAYPEAGVGVLADRMKPPDMPSSFDEFSAASGNPDYAEFLDNRTAASRPRTESPPEAGYRFVRDAEGNILQSEPIPGSKAAMEAEAAAVQAEERQTDVESGAENVINTIDRTVRRVQANPNWTTGMGGALLKNIPGRDAHDVQQLLVTVKSNAGFEQLQAMRDASPTGGALGQVTVPEIEMLQSTIQNLEQSQTYGQFMRNLQIVRETYGQIVHDDPQYGGAPQSGAPAGLQDLYQKYGLE